MKLGYEFKFKIKSYTFKIKKIEKSDISKKCLGQEHASPQIFNQTTPSFSKVQKLFLQFWKLFVNLV